MPLNPATLTAAVLDVDVPPPQTVAAAAEAWFSAWWKYAKEMAYWNPALLLPVPAAPPAPAMPSPVEAAARAAFTPVLLPGLAPSPGPVAFFLALEAAMVAGWVAGSAVPGSLLPTYLPIPLVPIPVPGALQIPLLASVPIGLASPTKEPPRLAIATAISTWTPLSFLATVPGSPPVTVPIL